MNLHPSKVGTYVDLLELGQGDRPASNDLI